MKPLIKSIQNRCIGLLLWAGKWILRFGLSLFYLLVIGPMSVVLRVVGVRLIDDGPVHPDAPTFWRHLADTEDGTLGPV